MKFKLLGAGIAALALLASSIATEAADMPRSYKGLREPVAYYTWNGFYLGINGGYAWGSSDWTFPAVGFRPSGWMVGGTIGYNYQIGSIVLGLEGDYDWTNVGSSGACTITAACEIRNSYLMTFRGRAGFALDRFLPYLTGGGAYGDIKAIGSVTPFAVSAGSNRLGWTIGGGIEYAFIGNWSAKLEYLYVDLGSFDPYFAAPAVASVNFTESIFRAGINYKFSGPLFSRF